MLIPDNDLSRDQESIEAIMIGTEDGIKGVGPKKD